MPGPGIRRQIGKRPKVPAGHGRATGACTPGKALLGPPVAVPGGGPWTCGNGCAGGAAGTAGGTHWAPFQLVPLGQAQPPLPSDTMLLKHAAGGGAAGAGDVGTGVDSMPLVPPLPTEHCVPSQPVLGGHWQPPLPSGTMLLKQAAGVGVGGVAGVCGVLVGTVISCVVVMAWQLG